MKSKIHPAPSHRPLAGALALLLSTAVLGAGTDSQESETAASDRLIERGKYIVSTAGCHDCHTPFMMGPNGPEPDMSRALTGHPQSLVMPPASLPQSPWGMLGSESATAWAGPWGTSFTANLTPDEETGLGKWTLRNFVETIRTGRRLGRGRELLPPMPWPMYKNMTDEDLEAVYRYLQSLPAMVNKVPEPVAPPEAVAELSQ